MRPTSLIINLLLAATGLFAWPARAQFSDNFSDGNFTDNPAWTGQTLKFTASGGQLELRDSAGTGTAYLATPSSASRNATWEFFHRYAGNPSASNRADFYLLSDQADLSGPLNGYYLRIGGQAGTADQLVLYRKAGSTSTEILATPAGSALNNAGEVNLRTRVERDGLGNWQVWADREGDTSFILLGSGTDNTFELSYFSGVSMEYSSSRSAGFFFFDDFKVTGESVVDSVPPYFIGFDRISDNELQLRFSEALEAASAEDVTNYFVNGGIGFPDSAQVLEADAVRLHFAQAFNSGQAYALTVSGLADRSGNTVLLFTRAFVFYETEAPAFNDVIVTEIHAKPSESTPVPAAEFLEIHNRTGSAFQLQGWTVQDASATGIATLPARILAPGAYAVICDSRYAGLFTGIPEVVGVDGLPALNDSGDDITLRDSSGNLVFHLGYNDSWYRDNLKAGGGWSLEMTDTGLPCLGAANWRASADPSGGTPGRDNSVTAILSDDRPPRWIDVEVPDSLHIVVVFSEKIDPVRSAFLMAEADNGVGQIAEYEFTEPGLQRVVLTLPVPMAANTLYTLTLQGVYDCGGNEILPGASVKFGLPGNVAPGDLVLNEILFNPYTGQVDFVEVYNLSGKLLSASSLILAEAEPMQPDVVTGFTQWSAASKLIFPHDFLVLSSAPDLVKSAYYTPAPEKFLAVDDMPNFADEEGVVSLYRTDLELLDRLVYSEDWHYALLDDVNGVSLERMDMLQPTQDPDNWHSASSVAGFATPGYMNSAASNVVFEGDFSVSPQIITPDGDGKEDFAVITYVLTKPGYTGNLYIFDAQGRQIVHLVRNETLGTSGFFQWDGTDGNGNRARSGAYIVLAELFDLEGTRKRFLADVAIGWR